MGRHRRRYSHSLRDNVIQLRNDDDPAKLAEDWKREVEPELYRNAQRIAILLRGKPSLERVIDLWCQQREDFHLLVDGTDPERALWERRKGALGAAEARMAALVREIEAHNAEVRARRVN